MTIWTESIREGTDYDVRNIRVGPENEPHFQTRLIHYKKWEKDETVPEGLSNFVGIVRYYNRKRSKKTEGPLLIICKTGIQRNGTFAALDICMERLKSRNEVNLVETVRELRKQRYGCIQLESHYAFLNRAILNYAAENGYLKDVDELDLASFSRVMTERSPFPKASAVPQLNTDRTARSSYKYL